MTRDSSAAPQADLLDSPQPSTTPLAAEDFLAPEAAADLVPAFDVEKEPEFAGVRDRFPRERAIRAVRRLSRVSNLRSAALIAANWALILGSISLAVWSGHWAVWVAAAFFVATRQYALGILMHEGAHYLLFTNRAVNDILCDVFCAFPVGQSTTIYRESHFRHHWYTKTDRDPDWRDLQEDPDMWQWPKTRAAFAWLVVKSLLGLNMHKGAKYFLRNNPGWNLFKPLSPTYPLRARVIYVVIGVALYAFFALNLRYLPALVFLYAIPSVTILGLIVRLRTIAEHSQTEGEHELNAARTVAPPLWERLLIAPHGVNYHIEHHLYPSVPGPNLKQLHETLLDDEEYRARAHLTPNYFGVAKELTGSAPDREAVLAHQPARPSETCDA